ncbi:MAG: DoxX family protein [Myxococcaceae bacterium]
MTKMKALWGKVISLLELHGKSVSLLALRVVVGTVFFGSGKGKLEHLSDVIEYFRSLNIPAPELQAPFVAGLEMVGGILIILGLGTRLIVGPLAVTMFVAIATAKWEDVEGFRSFVGLQEVDYVIMFGVLLMLGPGKASVDFFLRKKFGPAELTLPATAPDPA